MKISESKLRELVRSEIVKRSETNENVTRESLDASNGNTLPAYSKNSQLLESKQANLSEGVRYHIKNGIRFDDPVYRPGSAEFFKLFLEAKSLYLSGLYEATIEESEILESDIGEWDFYEGKRVPLDFPMWNENPVNEIADKKPYSKGPGIILSRLGGLSPVKQSNESAPERRGVWAFIAPHFEPFLVGSTNDSGITGPNQLSRYELMKKAKGKEPGLKLRKSRYVGLLYTRLEKVPGAIKVNGWYLVDADSLRKYVFGRLRPDEFDSQAKWNAGRFEMKRREDMYKTSKDHYEVFVPQNKGKFVGTFVEKNKEVEEDDLLPEAKYKGREVTLGASGAKRSGGRAHVYVRDPKTGNVKKISFGSGAPDAMGDSDSHRKRRKSFGSRHGCGKNKNRLSASYWACRATKMFGRNIAGWW